jgi:hypothetical protein
MLTAVRTLTIYTDPSSIEYTGIQRFGSMGKKSEEEVREWKRQVKK